MATTGKFTGTQVAVYLNNKKVYNGLSKDFSLDTDAVEVTNDDSNGFKSFIMADHTGKISVQGVLEQQASVTSTYFSMEDILDIQINRTLVTCYMTTGSTGDLKLIASAYITHTDFSAPHAGRVEFKSDIQLTGTITIASQS